MEAILAEILAYAAQIAADAPVFAQVITAVETAIGAFRQGDQAALDQAHAQMTALANSLAPPAQ